MTLPLRTLTNAGDPLCTPDGQVLSGVHVSFQLVDRYGVETDVWDALTHERVGGEPIVATTNEDGEFSIDLWPNSRGNRPTRYRCTVDHPAFKAFSGTVDDLSLGPLQWVEFMAASATIAPQDLGEMSLYRQEFAAGLQTLGTAVGVAGASATASQGSASAAAAAQSAAAASAATASTQAGAAADAADQSASSASTASTQAGQAATSATLAQQWATRTDDEVAAGQGYGARKYALDAAGSASAASSAASAAAATVSGLQTALDGKVDASDPRLSDAREWTAATVTQPEAEAGTDTTRKAWTAQRVRQAVLGWWNSSASKTKLDGIAPGATANATDAQLRDRATHTGTQTLATISNAGTAAGKDVPASGNAASTQVVLGNDSRLTDAREWTAATVDQAEAEAGTATARRAWTAQRVFQAVAAWWAGSAAKAKLDGIATGATANATDAALRDRATHTGTQAISTIAGLDTALAGKANDSVALTDAAGTTILPSTAAASVASRLQVLRNNVKQVYADLADKAPLVGGKVPASVLPPTFGVYGQGFYSSEHPPKGKLFDLGVNRSDAQFGRAQIFLDGYTSQNPSIILVQWYSYLTTNGFYSAYYTSVGPYEGTVSLLVKDGRVHIHLSATGYATTVFMSASIGNTPVTATMSSIDLVDVVADGTILTALPFIAASKSVVLTDDPGTPTLPAAAAAPIASRLQVLRNNVKQVFADLAGKANASHNHAQGDVTGLQTALSGKVDASDPRLTDAREWTAATIDQAEAEAGTATARRAWTAQRVFQAVAAWWAGSAAKAKLDGIATGATANATDAQLRDRTTHTGVQAISTVTGLQAALDSKQATLVSGSSLKTLGGQSLLGSGDVPLGDFLYGAYDPDNGGGSDGDVYIQSDGKMWKKAAGAWTYTGIQFAAQTAAVLLAGAQTVAGVKTFSDRSAHAGAYTPSAQPAHSATPTFDCATSNVFEPAALTGNVTSITLSNAVAGQTVQIRFQQDATGGRTVAVPAGDKVDGSINTAANRVSWLILTYSARGARWEGNWLQVPA